METIQVNKKLRAPFSLLALKLIETDHDRCSLKTAVSMFYRLKKANFQFL